MFNVLIVILVITIPYIQKKQLIYNTENVIICSSENDVEKLTELLDENHIEYKIIGSMKVKMQDKEDFLEAERIVKEENINISVIVAY